MPAPGRWQTATVTAIRIETVTAKTFQLRLAAPSRHLAGQHYILRLTAPDGYSASRSYSVASAPNGSDEIELTIERLPDGEVSAFMHDEAMVGDEVEVRGPIGGWFVWQADVPALLIGGGSGLVPLMAMLRLARTSGLSDLVHLVVSVRSEDQLYYADELTGPETTVLYTRRAPDGWRRPPGHMTPDDLPLPLSTGTTAFVCGSAGFADAASDLLTDAGVDRASIRIERFGPTR